MEKKKHEVSYKALDTLEKVMFAQDNYGYEKYKTALNHRQHYNWLEMFLEEMADGLKYIQNEIDRKNQIIVALEYALDFEDPKPMIEVALHLLKMSGTGK